MTGLVFSGRGSTTGLFRIVAVDGSSGVKGDPSVVDSELVDTGEAARGGLLRLSMVWVSVVSSVGVMGIEIAARDLWSYW